MFRLERVFFDIKGAYLWTKVRDLTFCWASHHIRSTIVEVLGGTRVHKGAVFQAIVFELSLLAIGYAKCFQNLVIFQFKTCFGGC